MQIHIPDETFRHSDYTHHALLLDLAVMLYQKQVFNLEQATRLANRDANELSSIIRQRGIVLRESQTDERSRRQELLSQLAEGRNRWQHLREVNVAAWIRQDRSR